MASNRSLIPEAKNGLAKFKNEVASEMGVPFSDHNGIYLQNNAVALEEKWLKEW